MAPKHVREYGTFAVSILSREEHRSSEVHESLSCHRNVLLPLLQAADECCVYGIKQDSRIFEQSSSLLSATRGKHWISLDGDPITGHELLWNAHRGERGSIVILIPEDQFDTQALLSGCHGLFMLSNFRAGHTPAAIQFAREKTKDRPMIDRPVCLCHRWQGICRNGSRPRLAGQSSIARRSAGAGIDIERIQPTARCHERLRRTFRVTSARLIGRAQRTARGLTASGSLVQIERQLWGHWALAASCSQL
jgi:hypothetical protein